MQTLQDKYSTYNSLDRALSIGMQALSVKLNIRELEFMDASRMFGSWARNIYRCSKDDVGLAMNHKDQSNQITDIYITKDWSIIDEVGNFNWVTKSFHFMLNIIFLKN